MADQTIPQPTWSRLEHAISCYPILASLASHMSTLDLFHLALTSRSNYGFIMGDSATRFAVLRRNCLCDGHGLRSRQDRTGINRARRFDYIWGPTGSMVHEDEEIEVRVFNIKCDETHALPCIKCGINICEECRHYPRVPPSRMKRRPHLNSSWEKYNVMVMCPKCEERTEEKLREKNYFSELCDCDVFKRWICTKCVGEERKEASEYDSKHTKFEGGSYDSDDEEYNDLRRRGKLAGDHQHDRWFFCPCGGDVAPDARFRCIWCKRKHLPESEWYREWQEVGRKMPWLENDPTYPYYVYDERTRKYPVPYPPLPYSELMRDLNREESSSSS